MKHTPFRIGALTAAMSVVICTPALVHGESSAEAGWAKMTQCASITDDKARHTCTDDALRDAGLLESKATAQRKAFGLPKPTPSPLDAPVAPAAAPSAAAAGSAVPPAAKKEKDQVEVTLARIDQGGDGKLTLTTSAGAVWRLVDRLSDELPPKQGDSMKIKAKSLGSFSCQTSKYVWFRCYRVK